MVAEADASLKEDFIAAIVEVSLEVGRVSERNSTYELVGYRCCNSP